MSDRLLWSSNMTQDYIKGLSDEEKRNMLVDRGYDPEMLDGADLDDIIDNDDYMWQDDSDDFVRTIVPMINSQTNGMLLVIDKDDPQGGVLACQPEDLVGDLIGNGDVANVQIYDVDGNLEVEYFNKAGQNVQTLELYAVPSDKTAQQDFMTDIMPSFYAAKSDQVTGDDGEVDTARLTADLDQDLMDVEVLEDFVDKDQLRKLGTRIKNTLNEEYEEVNECAFPKEQFNESTNSGIGYENAEKFLKYLTNNDRVTNGPFGEDPIINDGGAVRLYSQTSDVTFTFTDDGGVVVEGHDESLEDEGRDPDIEEYFDTVNDFVTWYKGNDFAYGSDMGGDIDRYLFSEEEPVEESLTEGKDCEAELEEAKEPVDTSALAEEVEELKEDIADFGPEGFYQVPFSSFEKEFPVFTNKVLKDFLVKYVQIKPEEMSDPEVLAAWESGDLITEQDWDALLEGAEKKIEGVGFQWDKTYPKHQYKEAITESNNTEKLKAYYGSKFDKEEALEEAKYTKDELVDKFGTDDVDLINAGNEEDVELVDEPLNEAEDYLVVPGDLAVAKDVMASEGK